MWMYVEIRLVQCGQDGLRAIGCYLGYFNIDWIVQWQNCPEALSDRESTRRFHTRGRGRAGGGGSASYARIGRSVK
jgi:hypothetical protein